MAVSYQYAPTPLESPAKVPEDYLDYTLSWFEEFAEGGGSPGDSIASITSMTVAPTGSLTISSGTIVLSNQAVMFWAASGTINQAYSVSVEILTAQGREYDRTLVIPVVAFL
jgi:hypothetical protein